MTLYPPLPLHTPLQTSLESYMTSSKTPSAASSSSAERLSSSASASSSSFILPTPAVSQNTLIAKDLKGKGNYHLRPTEDEIYYRSFRSEEEDLPAIMRLVEQELSEPYNHYTFRYFLMDWPHLTFMVYPDRKASDPIGTIICKQDSHKGKTNRGYIAMLSVDKAYRRKGIASTLVKMVIEEMGKRGAHEVVLETEYDNESSLRLYDSLGFLREKRLHRFYSNGKDAFRLILPLPSSKPSPVETPEEADRGRWNVAAGPDGESGGGYESHLHDTAEVGDEDRYFPHVDGRSGTPIPPRPREVYDYYI